jgi:hypothetical protein
MSIASATTQRGILMKKVIFLACLAASSCADLNRMVVYTDETTKPKQVQQRAYYQPLNADTAKPESIGAPMETLEIHTNGGKIKINGKTYMDQSGAIDEMTAYSDSGYITYLRSGRVNGYSNYTVMLDRPFKAFTKKSLASFTALNGRYQFSIPNHEDRFASKYLLTSQGVILSHEGGFFSYLSENFVSDIHEIPEGFEMSPVQAEDISKANYLALVKDNGPIKVGIVTIGGMRAYEVIFVDIKTGVVRASEVVRVDVTTNQSYFDSFHRMMKACMTNQGFIVFSLDSKYQNLYASNLHTGQRKSLVFRENGISNYNIGKDAAGLLWLRSVYGSNDERYFPDVVQELAK